MYVQIEQKTIYGPGSEKKLQSKSLHAYKTALFITVCECVHVTLFLSRVRLSLPIVVCVCVE